MTGPSKRDRKYGLAAAAYSASSFPALRLPSSVTITVCSATEQRTFSTGGMRQVSQQGRREVLQ